MMSEAQNDIEKALVELERRWAHELARTLESGFDFHEIDLVTRASLWPRIIRMAMGAGLDYDEVQNVTGASPSTVNRWLLEGIMPRDVTQKLMTRAMAEFLAAR